MRNVIGICASCLAFAAIVVGLCFLFLGNKSIELVPSYLEVEKIGDEYYLITEFNNEYKYKFVLEQEIEEEFITVDTVISSKNAINLKKQQMVIIAGQNYRFAACYVDESGSKEGEYTDDIIWQATWGLDGVDYDKVEIDTYNKKIEWKEVLQADYYKLSFVEASGEVLEYSVDNCTEFDYRLVKSGKYKVYIFAASNNDMIDSSIAGVGFDLNIEKRNEITDITKAENSLSVVCSELVEEFGIYVNGALRFTLKADEVTKGENAYTYLFEEMDIVYSNIDFTKSKVQIKSFRVDNVLESEFKEIE